MNWDIVECNWKQFKGEVKGQWGALTDDHLDVIAGRCVELSGKIQEAYGITEDEAEKRRSRFDASRPGTRISGRKACPYPAWSLAGRCRAGV
jgi:uncharacterized protein YjbJ (UPF0337 family)